MTKKITRPPAAETAPDVPGLEAVKAEAAQDDRPAGEASTITAGEPAPAPAAPETRRKRGRPPGRKTTARSAPAPVAGRPADLIPRSVVAAVIKAPYELAARRLGDHWRLTDQEAETMIDPHLAVAGEYLPDWMKQHPALYGVLLLHALAVFGKVELHYKLRRAQAEHDRAGTHLDGEGDRPPITIEPTIERPVFNRIRPADGPGPRSDRD